MPRRDESDDEDEYDDEEDERPRRRRRRPSEPDPALRFLVPVSTSGWAIAAGYLALFSVLCLPAPLALGAGLMALRELRRKPKLHGHGRAWFGVVIGGLFTLLTLFFLVLALIQRK